VRIQSKDTRRNKENSSKAKTLEAIEAIKSLRKGLRLGEKNKIKDLINEGRK